LNGERAVEDPLSRGSYAFYGLWLVRDVAGSAEMRGRLPLRMVRGLRWARYLVITLKGVRFAERWYHAAHVPPTIARLYQLLLKLIRSKGVVTIGFGRRIGYGGKVINQALSRGYVTIGSGPRMLSDRVRERIVEMIGEAPRDVYA